jgi:hypothetical protein
MSHNREEGEQKHDLIRMKLNLKTATDQCCESSEPKIMSSTSSPAAKCSNITI